MIQLLEKVGMPRSGHILGCVRPEAKPQPSISLSSKKSKLITPMLRFHSDRVRFMEAINDSLKIRIPAQRCLVNFERFCPAYHIMLIVLYLHYINLIIL